ncbi:hypothetical protein DM02DRAFT_43635 [Periconia macrospinosa]|uniref:Uncharacterized protein n=1 Tax=Periconia macrospinosa TaxID=97972 RepID=A0A2V1CX78_9PLEO|nr:hypothetical protein DM02DRAFT_43635 [Periconia macrospinosa]
MRSNSATASECISFRKGILVSVESFSFVSGVATMSRTASTNLLQALATTSRCLRARGSQLVNCSSPNELTKSRCHRRTTYVIRVTSGGESTRQVTSVTVDCNQPGCSASSRNPANNGTTNEDEVTKLIRAGRGS